MTVARFELFIYFFMYTLNKVNAFPKKIFLLQVRYKRL